MLASPTSAQVVVRGRVVEFLGNHPVEGALVMLVDSAGHRWDQSLSNSTGGFLLRAPFSGSFLLRADRIGLRGRQVEITALPENTEVHRIELSAEPILLDEITVVSQRRCLLERDMGEVVSWVWREARQALEAAAFTYAKGVYRYRINRFQRTLDGRGRLARQEDSHTLEGVWMAPFESLSAEELLTVGFVRQVTDGYVYSAPDAGVLLSRLFLDGHCFRMEEGTGEPGALIGLAFEPTSDREDLPDIKGTLWIDPTTSELRRLDFKFVNLASVKLRALEGKAGGFMAFQALPNGTWIIREWQVRIPLIEEQIIQMRQLAPAGFQGSRVTGFWEEGGQVESVVDRHGNTVLERERAILTGVVLDLLGLSVIPGAHVRLSGVEAPAMSDEEGRFWFRDVSEGDHELIVTWPALAEAGHWSAPMGVTVRAGETASARPRMPPDSTFLSMACKIPNIPDGSGVLVLRIEGSRGSSAEGEDSVTVRWRDSKAGALGTMELRGTSDSRGRFVACGVPKGRTLRVEVVRDGDRLVDTAVKFPEDVVFLLVSLPIQPVGLDAQIASPGPQRHRGPDRTPSRHVFSTCPPCVRVSIAPIQRPFSHSPVHGRRIPRAENLDQGLRIRPLPHARLDDSINAITVSSRTAGRTGFQAEIPLSFRLFCCGVRPICRLHDPMARIPLGDPGQRHPPQRRTRCWREHSGSLFLAKFNHL